MDKSGSAFPGYEMAGSNGDYWPEPYEGLTKREYFAAKALQGILSGCGHTLPHTSYAKQAFDYADAMLAQSQKEPE